jgi:hypothetical protein
LTLRPEDDAFLRHQLDLLRRDPVAMLEVRRLVRERTGAELNHLSDELALAHFARHFSIRHEVPVPRKTEGGAAPPAASSAQPAPSPRPAAPRGPEPEAATFPANHSPSAQAAALTSASESGVPFCEECARAAAERQAASQ